MSETFITTWRGLARSPGPSAIAIAVAVFAAVYPAASSADPIVDYPVPGTNQAITRITPDNSGGVWFVQSLTEQPENATSRLRVGSVGANGEVEALGSEIPGKALFTQIAPAADGGLWVLGVNDGKPLDNSGPELAHISANAATESTAAFPERGLNEAMTEGNDGRAWVLRCKQEAENQTCFADAVTTAGVVTSYAIPSLNYTAPPGETSSSYLQPHVVPTSAGVWFGRTMHNQHETVPEAAFVKYSGTATPVSLPAGSELIAPAAGEAAWWEHFEGSSVTIGQVNRIGETSDLHTRPASFEYPNSFANEPGRNGDLLWSDNTPWSDEQTGRLGVYSASGGATEYIVAKFAVTVPLEPTFWSGACSFGNFLYEASNGALWAVSGGHPNMLSAQQTTGGFATFLPVNGVPRELGIGPPVESTTGALWFALKTQSGEAILARANPLAPPPGLPPYPAFSGAEQRYEPPPAARTQVPSARAAIARALDRIHVALTALRRHRAARIRIDFPFPGVVTLRLLTQGGRHHTLVGAGRLARSTPGVGEVLLHLNRVGAARLAHRRKLRLILQMTMTTAHGTSSRTVNVTI